MKKKSKPSINQLTPVKDVNQFLVDSEVFILAAGFEKRAIQFLKHANFKDNATAIFISYNNHTEGNSEVREEYLNLLKTKFSEENIEEIVLKNFEAKKLGNDVVASLGKVPGYKSGVAIDISGMPSFAMFAVLNAIREIRPYENQNVLYTAAREYRPTYSEYQEITAAIDLRSMGDFNKTMAKEMLENVTFSPFAGHRSNDGDTCLAIFAGYEPHRATGVLEEINPSLLLMIYADPLDESLKWREDLSRVLHKKFEDTRRCAVECVPSHDLQKSLDILRMYYDFLIDEFDFTIAPLCSKVQSLAVLLFWEQYREVKINFPVPIGYNPSNAPIGIGASFQLNLSGRVSL